MSGDQKAAAFAISGVSLLIVIARHIWPAQIILDQATMLLLALAALPWLTLFFKKFKIPGVGEAETQDRAQGATQNPLPPADVQPRVAAAAPSADALKVLATLWRYQRQTFGNDLTKRWTFTVHPSAREYPRFLAGLSETVNRGWWPCPRRPANACSPMKGWLTSRATRACSSMPTFTGFESADLNQAKETAPKTPFPRPVTHGSIGP
jgi:hypothetical protein